MSYYHEFIKQDGHIVGCVWENEHQRHEYYCAGGRGTCRSSRCDHPDGPWSHFDRGDGTVTQNRIFWMGDPCPGDHDYDTA